jgi:hypothetical protein
MDIRRRFFDSEYNTAYKELLELGFRPDDFTVGTKGNMKVVLGKENVTLLYRNAAEEMTYGSFIELAEKYNDVRRLLERKGLKKKDTRMGVDIYENKNDKVFVGRMVKIIFGKTKDKLTYDEAISVFTSY